MRLPEHPTYSPPPEIDDPRFSEILCSFCSDEVPGRVVAASDVLALARSNTVATLNFTPVHQRAAQLAAIDRWIDHTVPLLRKVESFPTAARFLTSQLVTDIVSYADALVTRDNAGPKQQLQGLNNLVEGSGRAAIDQFAAVFNFHATIAPLRDIRNEIGAHIDTDGDRTLNEILVPLDELDLEYLTTLHLRLRAAFHAVCREVAYLRMYGMKESALSGVAGGFGPAGYRPFDPDRSPPAEVLAPPAAPQLTCQAIDEDLKSWCARDENAPEVRGRLWSASTAGPIVERTQRIGKPPVEFRLVHTRLRKLMRKADGERLDRLLDLVQSLAAGCPDPLAEILRSQTRRLPSPSPLKLIRILLTLGDLPVGEPKDLRLFLKRFYGHPILEIRRAAVLADFRIGSLEISQAPEPTRSLLREEFTPVLDRTAADARVATGLAIGGQLVGGNLWFLAEQHEHEYHSLVEWLGNTIREEFPSAAGDLLDQLLGIGDFCGIGVHVSDTLALDDPGRRILLTTVDEWIAIHRHHQVGLQSQINRGIARLRLGRTEEARAIVEHLWGRVSHSPGPLVAMLRLYSDAGGPGILARSEDIRRHFHLSPELARELDEIEFEVRDRVMNQR